MAQCERPGCTRTVGKNGIGCHECVKELVPDFLLRSLFTNRDSFTSAWIKRQVAHYLRGEPISA